MYRIKGNQQSDLWWLPKNIIAPSDLLVYVGHHYPLTDEDTIEWFHSVNKYDELQHNYKLYNTNFLNKWRLFCNNINIYRSLKLFDKNHKATILGPFLIDIDNQDWTNGLKEDLDDSLIVARKVLDFLKIKWDLDEYDMRIFFSGRKGFNIEARPEAIGIYGSINEQIKLSSSKLDEIISYLSPNRTNVVSIRGTVIDRIYGNRFNRYELKHSCIRLHWSWNKWMSSQGICIARRKIQLTPDEVVNMTASEICTMAER